MRKSKAGDILILIFIMSPPSKKWQTNKPTNRLKVTKKMNVSTWNRVNFVICDKYAVQKKKLTQNSNERFETTRNWNVIKKTNIPSKDRILVNRWGRHQFFLMTSHHSLLYCTYTRFCRNQLCWEPSLCCGRDCAAVKIFTEKSSFLWVSLSNY